MRIAIVVLIDSIVLNRSIRTRGKGQKIWAKISTKGTYGLESELRMFCTSANRALIAFDFKL